MVSLIIFSVGSHGALLRVVSVVTRAWSEMNSCTLQLWRLSSELTSLYTRSRMWPHLWVGDVTCYLKPNACMVSLNMYELALVRSSTCIFRSLSITMLLHLPVLPSRSSVIVYIQLCECDLTLLVKSQCSCGIVVLFLLLSYYHVSCVVVV